MAFRVALSAAVILLLIHCCDAYGPECLLPQLSGSCEKGHYHVTTRYYYNAFSMKCLPFPYSGCGGNSNNFLTERDCQTACFRSRFG